MTRRGEARVSPDAFETIRYVHAPSLPHCRLISPMLAKSAFGTVTGALILPRKAPVGKRRRDGKRRETGGRKKGKKVREIADQDKTIAYTYRKQDC